MAYCWASGLPKELLFSILEKLFSTSDYLRFSVVCKSWLSVAVEQRRSRLKSCNEQLPMLMIPTDDNSDQERRSLYSITREGEGKFYNFKLRVPYNKRCCGSSYGWLAIIEEENLSITLINPFSGETKPLPRFDNVSFKYKEKYGLSIKKVILSVNPSVSPDDYTVVAVVGVNNSLAIHRSRDSSKGWGYLKKVLITSFEQFRVSDLIFYKGQLHVVDARGEALSIDFDFDRGGTRLCNLHSVVTRPAAGAKEADWEQKTYLVESSEGDLLLVRRFLATYKEGDKIRRATVRFKVFKMVSGGAPKKKQGRWVEINGLAAGDALFLGDNHSVCVSAFRFSGFQPNCIYYTDDNIYHGIYGPYWPRDMGVFNLEDGSIGTHYTLLDHSQKHMPPAIWIFPTFGNYNSVSSQSSSLHWDEFQMDF